MLAVIIRVLPWAFFGIGSGIWNALAGTALAAAASAVVAVYLTLIAGKSWRTAILDLAGLIYFAVNAVLLVVVSGDAVEHYVAAGSQLFLAAVVGGFLVLGIPFTEPIALADMDAEERQATADNPHFHAFCVRLTLVWLVAFIVGGVILVGLTASGQTAIWITIVVISAALTLPIIVQQRMIASVTDLRQDA